MTEDEKPASQDETGRRLGSAAAATHGKDLLKRKQEYDRQVRAEREQERRRAEEEERRRKESAVQGRQTRGAAADGQSPRRAPGSITAPGGALGPVITSRSAEDEKEDQVLLTWKVHLLRRNRKTGTWLGIAVLAGVSVVWISFHSIGWVLLSLVLLLGSITTYILPITYTLTDRELRMRTLVANEAKPWRRFAGFSVYSDAVHVAFDQHSFRGRMLRGYTLYFEGNREEVMAIVRDRVKPRS